MDNLITAFKIFIGLKIGTFITGMVAQLALLSTAVKGATISFHALNVAIRANPIGLLLTVIQAAVVGVILFHKELVDLGNRAINFVIRQIDKLKLKFFQLVHLFNKIPGVHIDVSSNIDELEEKIFQSLHKFDEEVPEIKVDVQVDFSELDDLEADVGAVAQTTNEKTNEIFEGLKKGIGEAMTSAQDTMGNFKEFGKTVFEDTTDEIAKMVHTGKADFKSLANAFIGELIRMQVKASAAKFLDFLGGASSGKGE